MMLCNKHSSIYPSVDSRIIEGSVCKALKCCIGSHVHTLTLIKTDDQKDFFLLINSSLYSVFHELWNKHIMI